MIDPKELRRLHEAAREGPWLVKNFVGLEIRCDRNWTLAKVETPANALLIAAARNALPELLDRLEAAEAENARLRMALSQVAYLHNGRGGAKKIAREALGR